MANVSLRSIGTDLSVLLPQSERDAARLVQDGLDRALAEKVAIVHDGWGDDARGRVHEKGKWTTWERIDALVDPGTDLFELGTLVNWGRSFAGSKRQAPGAGVITAIATVHGRRVIVIANDNTVASGSWWPLTPEKIQRAQEVALRLRLAVVYLVDCSGLFLPEQSRSFPGRVGAGHIFAMNARLADAGVAQIAAVSGDCIAGGGYMPIISDRVVMTESAYMVIAGAALVRGAKSLKLTSLDIGGPEVHVHQSHVADARVPNDSAAIAWVRAEVNKLPTSSADFWRHGAEPSTPMFPATDLSTLLPADNRHGYAIEEVLARLLDDSLFHEVLPGVGREMVTGVGRVCGLWCAFVANRQGLIDEPGIGRRPGGALYREGIAKISAFARTAGEDGLPLVWLQDISGFDIGVDAERLGLLGYGSSLIYTNSTQRSPVFTILLRRASGAGYYAMHGLPFEPVVQLATPNTRLAVMDGRTLAIAAYNSKLDDNFEIASSDPAERAAVEKGMAETAARIESDMDPIASAARMDVDEVVPLHRLRAWLECLVESSWQGMGVRRVKNPRIWSLHDLEVLGRGREAPGAPLTAVLSDKGLLSPTVGEFVPALGTGAPVVAGTRLGTLSRSGVVHAILSPEGASGDVLAVHSGFVERGSTVVRLGAAERSGAPVVVNATEVLDGVAVLADTDGTLWLRPTPGAPFFAPMGGNVEMGATLALIEVMKTFTPVRAPFAGTVTAVTALDGAAISNGAVLFRLRH